MVGLGWVGLLDLCTLVLGFNLVHSTEYKMKNENEQNSSVRWCRVWS